MTGSYAIGGPRSGSPERRPRSPPRLAALASNRPVATTACRARPSDAGPPAALQGVDTHLYLPTAGHIRHTGCDSGHRVSEDDDRGHRVSKGRPTAARLVELRAVGWRDVAQAGRRGGDGTRDGAA